MTWCFYLSLWTGLSAVFGNTAFQSHYSLHLNPMTFEEAAEACSPGLLTSLVTKHEVDNILLLISRLAPPGILDKVQFWVGLWKEKLECTVPTLPLRGFKWMADGSDTGELSLWFEEPKQTCATIGCAALQAWLNGSSVISLGLVPVHCNTKVGFICKQTPLVLDLDPTSPEPDPDPDPHPSQPTPDTQKTLTPNYRAETPSDSGLDGEPSQCRRPSPLGVRSLVPDPGDDSRIQVECWTPGALVELHCSGRPALWHRLDGSVADLDGICTPCESGFHKNSLGGCEDVDECGTGSSPCRTTCLNTPGSYRCVCTDEDGHVVNEDSPTCKDAAGPAGAGLLIPVLVAVGALVVLVVLVAVVIKCCMVRRSKRQAAKKAEKMSLNSRDETKSAI